MADWQACLKKLHKERAKGSGRGGGGRGRGWGKEWGGEKKKTEMEEERHDTLVCWDKVCVCGVYVLYTPPPGV